MKVTEFVCSSIVMTVLHPQEIAGSAAKGSILRLPVFANSEKGANWTQTTRTLVDPIGIVRTVWSPKPI